MTEVMPQEFHVNRPKNPIPYNEDKLIYKLIFSKDQLDYLESLFVTIYLSCPLSFDFDFTNLSSSPNQLSHVRLKYTVFYLIKGQLKKRVKIVKLHGQEVRNNE